MKIQRVRLKDFRGVVEEELAFASTGVTIIEGPNEIGKTSVALGLDLIFSEYDSSSKQIIKSYRPVGRDVGPEVEVELTAGGFHVVFAKRWLKSPMTTLRVTAPAPEDYVGRTAHDRMLEILEESVDMSLWRALRYQQGQAISQASVGECPSLQAALDATSGRVQDAQGGEIELWALIEQERQRYVTPGTGRPVVERQRLDESLVAQETKVAELAECVAELEESADQLSGLQLQVTRIEGQRSHQRTVLSDLANKQRQIDDAESRVARFVAEVRTAESECQLASTRLVERNRLITNVTEARSSLGELEDEVSLGAPTLTQATQEEKTAREHRDAIQETLSDVRKLSTQAQSDVDHFRKTIRVGLLRDRIERIDDAVAKSLSAQEFLTACSLDQGLFDQITSAYQSVIEQRASWDAEHPPIVVTALTDLIIEVNGDRATIAKSESMQMSVGRELSLVFPDVAEVRFSGGLSVEERQDALDDATNEFEELIRQAGISGEDSMQQARNVLAERRRNQQVVEEARIVLGNHLDGQTPELIKAEFSILEEEITAYLTNSRFGGAGPTTQEEALATRDTLTQRIEELQTEEASAKSRWEAAVATFQELQIERAKFTERLDRVTEIVRSSGEELENARAECPDADFGSSSDVAREALADAKHKQRQEEESLANLDPETVAGLLVNARDVVTRLDTEIEQARDDVRKIEARLNLKGEAGLHDQLDAATTVLEQLRRKKAQTDRQARAVERLYGVMARHREEAKNAHVVPLKAAIEKLGRYVFGPTLNVELERETLSVLSRTVDGVTVPFEGLSGGAKEQVSLIARLACAQIVSGGYDDAGVPIIIDDALGNSDPERLATLGAVIAAAGRDSQVIVLTCVPDRFRNVGAASIVSLKSE